MKAYIAYIRSTLRLTGRDRMVLFFNYLFPLLFFILFANSFRVNQGSNAITQIVSMVLIMGILGTGFFGGGMRATIERETNILRRFKVAPIGPAPILVASIVVAWITYIPAAIFFLVLAHFQFGMKMPSNWLSLFVLVTVGVIAFRSMGLIIASVVNSMAESQVVIQLLYLPMLMLSGATIPLTILPKWLQSASQFIPATHLYLGMQGIFIRGESIFKNLLPVGALLLTALVGLFISIKLFRWEKEEKLKASAKLWLLAVLAPFLLIGAWQVRSQENLQKIKILEREMNRGRTMLIKDVRVFSGDGRVIEQAAVLIRGGKIAEIYEKNAPAASDLKAEQIEGSGKTLIPALIDTQVQLMMPGGIPAEGAVSPDWNKAFERAIKAYLYSGVVAIRSTGDPLQFLTAIKGRIDSGEELGAQVHLAGPLFTQPNGPGAESARFVPQAFREQAAQQLWRYPKSADEARSMVAELKAGGATGIRAAIDDAMPETSLSVAVLNALGAAAREHGLSFSVQTATSTDALAAAAAGAQFLDRGVRRDALTPELAARLKGAGVYYNGGLAALEAMIQFAEGRADLLSRTLVQQVGPAPLLVSTREKLKALDPAAVAPLREAQQTAAANLKKAYDAGVSLVAASGSGQMLLVHGPGLHREMQLWAAAGIPPKDVLMAATRNAAQFLRISDHSGQIRKGFDATVMLVEGNPLEEISATERIVMLVVKGERVARSQLFEEEDSK